jgi:hypothetical protein
MRSTGGGAAFGAWVSAPAAIGIASIAEAIAPSPIFETVGIRIPKAPTDRYRRFYLPEENADRAVTATE